VVLASAGAVLAALALLAPRAAHADAPPTSTGQREGLLPYSPAHLVFELGAETLVLDGSTGSVGKFRFAGQFSGLTAGLLFYGVDARWSAGLTGAALLQSAESSFGDPYIISFGRIDAEARFHPVLWQWLDVWASGLLGVGVFDDQPGPTFGAHVALGAGADLRPITALTLGIHMRTGVYWAPELAGVGSFGEASGAFVIGVHMP
jgi:hypothetical protein